MNASSDLATGRHFRGQILLLRGCAGLTQRALATHLGMSRQAIQPWEADEGYPSAARLLALIALHLQRRVFTAGREAPEARALWELLRREASQRTRAVSSSRGPVSRYDRRMRAPQEEA
jgi:transcriptional regulator with XRE-family HTH domain